MAEMAVFFAREKLLPLMIDEANLLWGIPKEFADISHELEYIQAFLKDADRRAAEGDHTNEGIRTWVKQLMEASFRIEDVIDEYMIYVGQQPRDLGCATLLYEIIHFIETLMPRHRIASEIQQIKSFVHGIKQRSKDYHFQPSVEQGESSYNRGSQSVQWHDPRLASRFLKDADVVGFEGPVNKLIGWLVEGPTERIVISVVGMGGLGKTTLVGRVFDNEKVKTHFDFHAWITVSQSYTVEKLMGDLLKKLPKEESNEEKKELLKDISKMDRDSLIDEVRSHMQQKRYIVIFDDVWSVELWGKIENAMLDNNNGSRILITTRSKNVVNSCVNSHFDQVHELEPLTFEKSMELFCKKAFRCHNNGYCPEDLLNISFDFVKKCKGLPLAIVAIGSLLHGKEKTPFEWEKIRRSLSSEMEKNPHLIGVTKILGFSYGDLPYYLKTCLLYFGIYPEDYEVKSTRLIRQWIAEGFVKDEEGKALEDLAQQYLTELIGRSLVQVSSFTADGKARTCHVHDLLHDMILRKFKDLSFCQCINKEDESMSSGMIRRLSIANISNDLMRTGSSHTRSLHVFTGKELALSNENVKRIPTKYKLLKVLDFEDGQLDFIPENWGNLAHLKYLSLKHSSVEIESLPKFIGKLLNLETLDIRDTYYREIPKEICKLTKLRHLMGEDMRLFQLKNSLGGMTSLQTLRKVSIDHDENELIKDDDVVELLQELGKLKQLKSLGLTGVKEGLGSVLCSSINEMQTLEKLHIATKSLLVDDVIDLPIMSTPPMLRKLRLQGKLAKFPEWVPKLQNLVKLYLISSHLTEDPLKSLQNMPHLLFLYLGPYAYEGESLYFCDGGFPQLKELCLYCLPNLNSIIIDKGALYCLEKLELGKIPLKTIPLGIQYLEKLHVLKVLCSTSDEFQQWTAPHGGPKHPNIDHVPLIDICQLNAIFEDVTYHKKFY